MGGEEDGGSGVRPSVQEPHAQRVGSHPEAHQGGPCVHVGEPLHRLFLEGDHLVVRWAQVVHEVVDQDLVG